MPGANPPPAHKKVARHGSSPRIATGDHGGEVVITGDVAPVVAAMAPARRRATVAISTRSPRGYRDHRRPPPSGGGDDGAVRRRTTVEIATRILVVIVITAELAPRFRERAGALRSR